MRRNPEFVLEWSEKIKRQLLSNKSAVVWCKEEGIPYSTFQYWRKSLSDQKPQADKKHFVEISPDPFEGWIEIQLPGAKLAISKNFDRGALLFCLKLLGGH